MGITQIKIPTQMIDLVLLNLEIIISDMDAKSNQCFLDKGYTIDGSFINFCDTWFYQIRDNGPLGAIEFSEKWKVGSIFQRWTEKDMWERTSGGFDDGGGG